MAVLEETLPTRLLTVEEAARVSGLSPHTIRAWARAHKIPFRRLGKRMLFHPTDLESVVTAALVPAKRQETERRPGARPDRR
jgi:excisionase family DNA binding protein